MSLRYLFCIFIIISTVLFYLRLAETVLQDFFASFFCYLYIVTHGGWVS